MAEKVVAEMRASEQAVELRRARDDAAGAAELRRDATRREAVQRREHELQDQAREDPLRFYDFIIDYPHFTDLVGRGWPLRVKPGARGLLLGDNKKEAAHDNEQLRLAEQAAAMLLRCCDSPPARGAAGGNWRGVVVTMLGDYNKGKTWLCGKITGHDFPSGDVVHTPGICARALEVQKVPVVMLDTAGLNSPVDAVTNAALQEKKAEEAFMRDLCFFSSDAFIYVVNHITAKEQLELFQLCRDLQQTEGKALGRVIVIHNLRGITTRKDLHASLEVLKQKYGARDGASGCQVQPEEITVDGRTETIEYLQGFRGEGERQNTFLESQQHFVMGQEGTPAGHLNAHVIHKVKNILLSVPSQRRSFDFQSMVLENAERLVPRYFKLPTGCKARMEVSDEPSSCRVVAYTEQGEPSAEAIQLKQLELGAFVRVDSAGPMASTPYSIFESDSEVRLMIELPGVRPNAVKTTLAPEGNRVRVKVDAKRERPDRVMVERPSQRPMQFEHLTIDMLVDPTNSRFTHPKRPTKPKGQESHLHEGVLTLIWTKEDPDEEELVL